MARQEIISFLRRDVPFNFSFSFSLFAFLYAATKIQFIGHLLAATAFFLAILAIDGFFHFGAAKRNPPAQPHPQFVAYELLFMITLGVIGGAISAYIVTHVS